MKKILVWLCCVFLSGCVTLQTPPNLLGSPLRSSHIDKVRVGMLYAEVAAIMGENIVVGYERRDPQPDVYNPITIKNPYRKEFLSVANKAYDVSYYFTNIISTDGIISEDELTPLVFERNILIGKGLNFLKELKK